MSSDSRPRPINSLVLDLTIPSSSSLQILQVQINLGLELSLQTSADYRPCLIDFSGSRPSNSQLLVLDFMTLKIPLVLELSLQTLQILVLIL